MTPANVRQQYPNQWVLLEVVREDENQRLLEVRVVAHSTQRDDVYDALLKVPPGIHVATLFTGSILQEGYAAAFAILWE